MEESVACDGILANCVETNCYTRPDHCSNTQKIKAILRMAVVRQETEMLQPAKSTARPAFDYSVLQLPENHTFTKKELDAMIRKHTIISLVDAAIVTNSNKK